jgi:regulatory helix-turn-helix LysR family protein
MDDIPLSTDRHTRGDSIRRVSPSPVCDLDRGVALDSLSALKILVRSAEASSFTAAGRQLGLSSSAVGKAVHAWKSV